ncbi:Uncharacterized protein FWK35_00027827 [Aphis craccivora]|uniref:Uncharacterized protein n=1 Tax=Aphis craccivora TaxID=307492 RepID=A0A6G0WNZ8_APHCR|nr:Uncharacterized protein FWK35_00027827 [Aphis craccivora]
MFPKLTNTDDHFSKNLQLLPCSFLMIYIQKKTKLQPAFNNKLPISVAKYNDLLKLCNSGVIPNRYHKEFKSLKRNENIDDVLGETDEEDNNIILETDPIDY